jgi:hypothetical protein
MTYLGPLMRIASITMENLPISWFDINIRCANNTGGKIWRQYQTSLMSIYDGSPPGVPIHVSDANHVYPGVQPASHDYEIDTDGNKTWNCLLDGALVELDYDEFWHYASGFYTAEIPAVIEVLDAPEEGSGDFTLSGSNVIINYTHAGIPAGSLWATGASIINAPNTDPFPGSVQNWFMSYNNPGSGTPGFPAGSGSQEYYLHSFFFVSSQRWAKFKPVP